MFLYLDVFAVVNLLVNFALLLGTAVLTGATAPWWRLALAAAAGAVYAVIALVIPGAREPWFLLGTGLAMLAIAFWPTAWRRALSQVAALALLSSVVAGMTLAWAQVTAPAGLGRWPDVALPAVLLPAMFSAWLAARWWQGVRRGAAQQVGEVWLELTLGEKKLITAGRIDSGNDAFEPLSGQPATILAEDRALPLTGPAEQLLAGKGEWPQRLRLVPTGGLDGKLMLLPAVRLDKMVIRGRDWEVVHEGPYIAVFPGPIDAGGRWHALVPAAMVSPRAGTGKVQGG